MPKNLIKKGRSSQYCGKNTPGDDWARSFVHRYNKVIQLRKCQNINLSRASKSSQEINQYFDNLEEAIKDVDPENIINYDETNFSDNPGITKCLFKRGTKYPEKIMNSSKSAISIMFAGNALGQLFPPYVVYKSEHLYDSWCNGGPPGTMYNRSKSGWFDSACFSDWFYKLLLPKIRRLRGPKLVIGDNLSTHFSVDIINTCNQNDIKFVMLPPNSTHLTQPLDVSFFKPLKQHWRSILSAHKIRKGGKGSFDKSYFPALLSELILKIKINNKC